MLYRDVTGWDIYLDQLTFAPLPVPEDGRMPPRMAMATAASFALLGLSLLFAQLPRTAAAAPGARGRGAADGLAGPVALRVRRRALVRVREHGGAHRHPVPAAVRRRAHAAPRRRRRRACSRARASVAAWRDDCCRPPIVVPLLAGALTMHIERRGMFGFEAAVSIFALSSIIVFVAFVLDQRRARRARRLACVAPPNVRCASPRSATSSSSRPRSTAWSRSTPRA